MPMKPRSIFRFYFLFLIAFGLYACGSPKQVQSTAEEKTPIAIKQLTYALHNPQKNHILISSHRGDWRNAPENSIQSLKNVIAMGVDICELDLKKTKDGHLVILHDNTIDRTMTGKGKPADFILPQLKEMWLKDGAGHKTQHKIPTFEEFTDVSKDKILLCIDKGFDYFDEAMDIVNKKNMASQIIMNVPGITLDSLKSLGFRNYTDDIMLNVIVSPRQPDLEKVIRSYTKRKRTIIHPTFATEKEYVVQLLPDIRERGLGLWLNALWPEHNANHHDDRAIEQNQPDETWGWLVNKGATIIQTDRPRELLDYLRKKKLHP